jgi:uncharacterized protein (DUF488 family)
MTNTKVATIGVYGFNNRSFFDALVRAEVTCLCDVRSRRGLRGSEYAFANSTSLQQRLTEVGITYMYRKDLAPSDSNRAVQKERDRTDAVAKRRRTVLSEEFNKRYKDETLAQFDSQRFLDSLPPGKVAFLCVEREPAACHRHLIAAWLADVTGVQPEHIMP